MGVLVRRDHDTGRMVAVSALAHVTLLALALFVLPLVKPRPLAIVAYTVELTDSSSLGGRLAPGRTDLPMGPRPGPPAASDAAPKQGEPTAKAEPPAPPPPAAEAPKPEPPKPLERATPPEPPKLVEPAVKLPSLEKPPPKPEAKKPPEPKPAEAKKPEPPKPEPKVEQKAPEPPKPTQTATKPNVAPKPADGKPAEAKRADSKPAADAKPAGKPNGRPDGTAEGSDAYASAADKWRAKGATGGGGGLNGTDTSPGPLGTPGYGGGGGGQVVGFEFLAYQQRVVTTVKSVWTNAAPRPGLVAKVRFQIAPNGDVSGVRLEQPSGDGVFDGSALRAVQRANPLPPPPARYVNEFREFVIEFHSEEGGHASG